MLIQITDSKKIYEVQKDFSEAFPYLKISFFSKPHAIGKASSKKLMLDDKAAISDCRRKGMDGVLEVKSTMKVSELETVLWNEFGLSAQVFRKSGNSWLETTATDSWTLEKQNKLGEDLSNFKRKEETEEFDNDRVK